MNEYGKWPHQVVIGGQSYRAELINVAYAERLGVAKIFALDGLPVEFQNDLVRASQISDVPHTWRVRECKDESEVDAQLLQLGKQQLADDCETRGSHIITYLADSLGDGSQYRFLAAGAIRNKLNQTYQDEQYPVVSRAIVAPAYRNNGLGSMIVEHRFLAVLNYFAKRPKAIHFGTESQKILHSVQKVEEQANIKYVYIGDEEYEAFDGPHIVADYLCFLPWFQQELLRAIQVISSKLSDKSLGESFYQQFKIFMVKGAEQVLFEDLENLFLKIEALISAEQKKTDSFLLIAEIFQVKKEIGAGPPRHQ